MKRDDTDDGLRKIDNISFQPSWNVRANSENVIEQNSNENQYIEDDSN